LKQTDITPKLVSSTGKKYIREKKETDKLLEIWDTIAKVAKSENMCPARMSRCVKNKNVINNY